MEKVLTQGYRTLSNWNQWLGREYLGCDLIHAEKQILVQLLKRHMGKHALLIGVPHQYPLIESTRIPCHSLATPLVYQNKKINLIETEMRDLPIATGSIDLLLLSHILELVDYPRQLLSEACRVIKPEGLIAICGFNPYSAWGIKKILTKHRKAPWGGHFIHANQIKKWLQLADFQLEQHKTVFFRPPILNHAIYQKLSMMESIGSKVFPYWGGVYILLARAKVIPLTPIRLKWKQKISDIRISQTISGHIARSSK